MFDWIKKLTEKHVGTGGNVTTEAEWDQLLKAQERKRLLETRTNNAYTYTGE